MARIVLTGLNGYGANFVRELLQDEDNTLVAVVSGAPQKSIYYEDLVKKEVHFYRSLKECLEIESADMAIICTPLHIHYEEVMTALKAGVHVFCEKPLTTTLDKVKAIKALAEQKNLTAAVGFQWSYSKGIQALKKDLLQGVYGRIHKIKTMAVWKRPVSYYTSSPWKGRLYGTDGEIIFDSVISNPTAHFLHNMLFLAGADMSEAWSMEECTEYQMHCYKAHDIETFDTISLNVTSGDKEFYFYGTLVGEESQGAEFTVECENGTIIYPYDAEGHIAGKKADGSIILYECPEKVRYDRYKQVLQAIAENKPAVCNVKTVEPFQQVIEYIRQNYKVRTFPKEDIYTHGDELYVKGLLKQIQQAYASETLALMKEEAGEKEPVG